jgi:MSHA biogenesis protein MshO
MNARSQGFTLVELIVVMVVTGVLAAGLVVFFRPAVTSYVNVVSRAELTDLADTAMRGMLRDIRLAVPNSFRSPDPNCFETIPTSAGGRYRSDVDINTAGSAAVDTSVQTTEFDVISPLPASVAAGDWIVVGNQNTNDVYTPGVNRVQISSVDAPGIAPELGKHRIRLVPPGMYFPEGYEGNRFVVVPNNQQAVYYSCQGASGALDARGNGQGTLFRFSSYGFLATPLSSCPTTATPPSPTARISVVATGVQQCVFTLNPNPGAIQGAGYVELRLRLTKNNESVNMIFGAHANNLP